MKAAFLKAVTLGIAAVVLFLGITFLFQGKPTNHPIVKPPEQAKTALPRRPLRTQTPSMMVVRDMVTNGIFATPAVFWQKPVAEEVFAKFHDWTDRYHSASASEKVALETEGVELANERRVELLSLIKNDPERALELTVPVGVRRELPASIESLLEDRVSGKGDFSVLGVLAEPGKEQELRPTIRTVNIDAQEYDAYVYGWRLGEPTRTKIPLNGIAVDNVMAVSANSVRILEPEEAAEAKAQNSEAICSVSGQSSTILNEEVAADVGGDVTFFCRRLHAEQANENYTAAQNGEPGPQADGGTEASTWTEGLKKVILIRVDFPDLQGAPLSDASATTLIQNLHNFYNEMSYARAGFYTNGAGSDFTPTFRMSMPAAYYGTNDYYNQLRTEARNAATAAGYTLGNYDRDLICMGSVPGFGWAGLAYVGGAGAWIRNSFGTGVSAHELGHNWGLNHANYWDTGGASIIGPGSSVEYGDIFDTMGSASAGNNHFNARYKNYLNWLTTNEVVTATTNGVYRVYAHDNVNSYGIRGLRVVKNSQTNYWVEFRQKFTSNKWLMSGGGLRRAQNGNQKADLLDITPGSTDGKNDSPIVIGRTFSDTQSGIHITAVGKGGTSPESLDVMVNIGAFPTNLPPTVDFSASATNAGTGVTINFTASASDPNGDDLAYYWDFGDGNFGTNSPTVSKSWATAGEYLVHCIVSDMKGGTARQSMIVSVGSPTTFRISGQVLATNGPMQGVRVYVSTTRMAYTDSDGTYDIVGLPAGSYTVNAAIENYIFTSNFVNNVTVGPTKAGLDFAAIYAPPTPISITTQPTNQVVKVGSNVVFTVAATGSTPRTYQWRFNGGNISGATASSYTRSNAQTTNAGTYSVVVSNLMGAVASANASLTVNAPPAITNQPQNQSIAVGATATFSVGVSGTAPLAYQWRQNGTNIASATLSSYSRPSATTNYAGSYTVVITNVAGAITSAPATLTILTPPVVVNPPGSQRVLENTLATFTVSAGGSAPFAYQWRWKNATIAGATNATLTLSNVLAASAGGYDVKITNQAGAVTSSLAMLTVSVRPTLKIPATFSNGLGQISILGTTGDIYVVETSSNAATWSAAGMVTNVGGAAQFIEGGTNGYGPRFYRARWTP